MICKLSSEAEIAFIICHEIAHDIEEHVENGIKKRYEVLYDKKNQKEIKQATDQDYNRNKSTEAVYNKILSQFGEHSRENETAADSIGIELFSRAGYSPKDGVKAIINLDSIDNPLFYSPIDFNSFFNLNGFSFDQEWLNPEKGTALWESTIEYKTPDSLKTHPDCKYRAESLERIIKNNNLEHFATPQATSNYEYIKTISTFEYIEHAIKYGSYSYALYCAIELQQKFKNNNYLKCIVGNCLYEIYVAQVNHRFSENVDFPNKKFPKAYNQLLYFLHNTNSSIFKELYLSYYNQHITPLKNNEYADYIGLIINGDDKKKEAFLMDIKSFETTYQKSYYQKQLTSKLNSKKATPKK